MNKLLAFCAAAAFLSGAAHAASEREDAAAVLRTVIRVEAEGLRSWSNGPVACVSPTIEEATSDLFRSRHRRRVEVHFRWGRLPDGRHIELEPTEVRQLADAVAAIVAEDPRPPSFGTVASDWLTSPFRLCDQERLGLLSLSSPAFHGDLAFVAVEFECALCGHGIDYALRRRDGRWEIVAELTRWVS